MYEIKFYKMQRNRVQRILVLDTSYDNLWAARLECDLLIENVEDFCEILKNGKIVEQVVCP